MSRENEPKARFALPVTAEEYTAAALLAARRKGSLRGLPFSRWEPPFCWPSACVFLTGAALAFFRR